MTCFPINCYDKINIISFQASENKTIATEAQDLLLFIPANKFLNHFCGSNLFSKVYSTLILAVISLDTEKMRYHDLQESP